LGWRKEDCGNSSWSDTLSSIFWLGRLPRAHCMIKVPSQPNDHIPRAISNSSQRMISR